ncbi:MAG: PIG-L deacetylase family protein [Methanoregula sp.]|nr:PIG-L deacetylase family protein [Methanoregula sp.]
MNKKTPVLILAAHPDDEVLGCGGTVARLVREGTPVSVAILGEGITSRYSARSTADPALLDDLCRRSKKAADILGVTDVRFFSLPDNRFDTVPLLDIVKIIENLINEIQPTVVFTQHGGDLNIDHTIVFKATLTASRPVPGSPVKQVLAYEVPSSTDWAFQTGQNIFSPNVFYDVSTTLDLKMDALKIYAGEMKDPPHPRSLDAVRENAFRWGHITGVRAAEAFESIREIR